MFEHFAQERVVPIPATVVLEHRDEAEVALERLEVVVTVAAGHDRIGQVGADQVGDAGELEKPAHLGCLTLEDLAGEVFADRAVGRHRTPSGRVWRRSG